MNNERRPENPAKTYLKRYRALLIQRDSLQRSINAAYERATSCTVRLKPISVSGGAGAYDRMAEDVARISDETAQLEEAKAKTELALSEIMEAIRAGKADLAERLAGEHMNNAYENMVKNGLYDIYRDEKQE